MLKNLMAIGVVSIAQVAEVISRARGNEYRSARHHLLSDVDVHIITKVFRGETWYIKWYVLEPNSIFISVHH